MSDINVVASASRSGFVLLNAQNGTITLPSGTLSADGDQGGGDIELYANTVTTVDGTVLSATQPTSAPSTIHGVVIVTSTINVAGTSGLQVLADGNGETSNAYVCPVGSQTRTSNGDLDNLLWNVSSNTCLTNNAPLTIAGSGALLVQANGNGTEVYIGGYPLAFNNAAVTLNAMGASDHNIQIGYSGSYSGTTGLTMDGTGAVLLNASGVVSGDAGGQIHVYSDQASITAPSFTMHADGVGTGAGGFLVFQPTALTSLSSATTSITANGVGGTLEFLPNGGGGAASITSTTFGLTANAPTSGGNAGSIYFQTGSLTLGTSTIASMTANGPTSGSGNGGYIDLSPGTIMTLKLGTNGGDIQLLTNGGSTGGNGGTIFTNPTGSVTIDTANAVSATVPGTTGTGGTVSLYGNPNFAVTSGLAGATINVDGKGTGDGGNITLQGNGTLTLGSAAGGLSLSAQNNAGTGNGGSITVGYLTTVTVSGSLDASAGTGGGSDGNGGTIDLNNIETLTVTGDLFALGNGSGSGGTITADSYNTDISTATVTATGGTNNGNGGTLNISNPIADFDQDTVIDVDAGDDSTGCCTAAVVKPRLGSPIDGVKNYLNRQTGDIVHCQQWSTGSDAWPLSFWDCTSNYSAPSDLDQVPVNLAASATLANLQGLLDGKGTVIYVVADAVGYNAVFTDNQGAPTGGLTKRTGAHTTTTPWESGSVGDPTDVVNPYSASQYKEVSAHELGHAVDIAFGVGSDSEGDNYGAWLTQDFNTLNYADAAFTVQRLPCALTQIPGQPTGTYYAGKIPFANVVDTISGLQMCANGQLNNAVLGASGPWPANITNQQVLQRLSTELWVPTTLHPAWVEPHAQIFAYTAVGNLGARPFDDAVFDNGYFPCIKSWATSELAGSLPTATTCTLTVQ
jgi:hypothetical protein